jgi:methyl-accepting chemotaxis protein
MNGVFFRLLGARRKGSAFRRLSAGKVPSLNLSVGCPHKEALQWSLALSGLEEAVSAAKESSAALNKALGGAGEVKRANSEASGFSPQQVSQVERLAQELAEQGLRDRLLAQNAHSGPLRAETAQRLLD